MSHILRFTTNIPEEVALRSTSGKRVEGRYGEQMMYNLFDDRIMYVPLIVAERIRELDIGAGEAFEICKAEAREGNRKWIEWRVRKYDEPQPRKTSPNSSGESAAPSSAPDHAGNGNSNGRHGRSQSHFTATTEGALVPVPVGGPAVAVMETALNAAAEIVQRVASRAAFNNQPLQFTSEDVRAIGLTIFIQAMRDGAAPWRG